MTDNIMSCVFIHQKNRNIWLGTPLFLALFAFSHNNKNVALTPLLGKQSFQDYQNQDDQEER
jgi:hypothetical protein